MAEAVAGSTWQREFPLNSQASSHVFQTPPTVALGDFKRSIVTAAGTVGALTNLDNTPTVDPAGSAQVKIILSASETTAAGAGGHINILGVDASGAEWDSIFISVDVEASATNARAADIQSRIPAALVSGRIDSSVGAMAANVITATAINNDAITAAKIADGAIDAATFAAGAITAAAIATDAIDADALAADAVAEIQSGLATGSIPSAATIADAIWDEATAGHTTAGTFGEQAKSDIDTLVTNVAAILLDTETDGVVLSTAQMQALADMILKRGAANTEDTADAASLTELLLMAFESSASGATMTIRKTGGTTFSTRTLTLDAAADPIVGIT